MIILITKQQKEAPMGSELQDAVTIDKEVEVEGTVSFSGTISVPMSDLADFDLSNVTIEVDLSSYDYDADLRVDEVSVDSPY